MELRKFIEKRIQEAREYVEAGGIGDIYDDAVRDLAALENILQEYDAETS